MREPLVLDGVFECCFSDPYEPAFVGIGGAGVGAEVVGWLNRGTLGNGWGGSSRDGEILASEGVRLRVTIEELPPSHTGTVVVE